MGLKKRSAVLTFIAVPAILILVLMGCQYNAAPTASALPKETAVPSVMPSASVVPSASQSSLPASADNEITYTNNQYGFSFRLPASWKGYSIINGTWQGTPIGGSNVTYSGPEIIIRNPAWTEKEPMQDIPIMIFTAEQWGDLQSEKFHIGAAPINPSELGRNSKYFFALPARYNFAFLKGFEEVEKILAGKPLKPIN